jgi:hypothetical protein
MNKRTVHIHIERLVVDGIDARGQNRFVRALEAQLAESAHQASAGGAFAGDGVMRQIGRVDAGEMRAGATPERAAGQVARAIGTAIEGKGRGRG